MATLRAPSNLTSFSVPFPRYVDVIELDDANAQSWTVPDGVKFAVFSADGSVYARVGGTAAVPTADVTDGTGSLLIQSTAQFNVEDGGSVSFIRAGSSTVLISIGCYS